MEALASSFAKASLAASPSNRHHQSPRDVRRLLLFVLRSYSLASTARPETQEPQDEASGAWVTFGEGNQRA